MDTKYLEALYPSLPLFSVALFSFMISLPRLRFWLKDTLDKKMADNNMRSLEFFSLTYYMTITEYLDIYAVLYLVSSLLVLLSPVWPVVMSISYWSIIATTTALVAQTIVTVPLVIRKALAASTIH